MGAFSNFIENKILDHVLRNTTYTPAATVYVALYTSDPTEADVGVEVAGNSYARTAVTFGAAASGSVNNSSDVAFPAATGAWGTITHFGIRDASTLGNMLFYGALTSSKVVANGDTFRFVAGSLVVTVD